MINDVDFFQQKNTRRLKSAISWEILISLVQFWYRTEKEMISFWYWNKTVVLACDSEYHINIQDQLQ